MDDLCKKPLIVTELLAHHANTETKNNLLLTPLGIAKWEGYDDMVKLLEGHSDFTCKKCYDT